MGRKSKAKFKLPGHTLPGINQKSETVNLSEGRSPSSAFQQRKFEDDSIINSAPREYKKQNGVEGFSDTTLEDGRSASSAFQQKKELSEHEKVDKLRDFLLSDAVGLQSLEGVDDWIDGKGGVNEAWDAAVELGMLEDVPAESPLDIYDSSGSRRKDYKY